MLNVRDDDIRDDDPNAPWMLDIALGGMTPSSRRKSWTASQRRREMEKAFFDGKQAPVDGWQPPSEFPDSADGGVRTPPKIEMAALPPLTLDDWRDRDLAEPDFIMGHWLTTTSRVLLTAATGLGKTNFGLALGMRVAAGEDFLHWHARRLARVLYIDGEMSRRLLRQRVLDEEKRVGITPKFFFALSHEDIPNFKPLNTIEGQAWINALIDKIGGVDLIIFDNIMCLTVGDMKDPEPWQKTLPLVLSLTTRTVGQIWIHHTGHDETRSYGDKSREWQTDTVAHLDAVKRDDTDVSFSMSFKKARERTPATRFDFQDVKVALINDRWEYEVAEALRQDKVAPRVQKAFEALINVIASDEAVALSGNRRAAHRDHWTAECNARGLIDLAQKPDSARTLMNTFRRELVAANRIACDGDLSWVLR
ncbi:AAA family ATPase [Bradyrhizobium japonicum]|uniref:AAA family ATPase n=1 Tax=Bradyrhizobium japonicum TaxID=375 RepID=UPI00057708A5|nr:AAA family ATPase [Bradyrhizobium japonicum]